VNGCFLSIIELAKILKEAERRAWLDVKVYLAEGDKT